MARGDFGFQLPVCCADDPDVHLAILLSADPAELSVLQQLQQLGLQRHLHLTDFVQEQRSAVCHLDPPGLGTPGASKSSLLISEQFALQQRARNGGTTDLDEWTLGPGGTAVNFLGDDFFARAALSQDQDRHAGRRCPLHSAANRLHSLRLPEDDFFGEGYSVGKEGSKFTVLLSHSSPSPPGDNAA